jgi:hypothetical protein
MCSLSRRVLAHEGASLRQGPGEGGDTAHVTQWEAGPELIFMWRYSPEQQPSPQPSPALRERESNALRPTAKFAGIQKPQRIKSALRVNLLRIDLFRIAFFDLVYMWIHYERAV